MKFFKALFLLGLMSAVLSSGAWAMGVNNQSDHPMGVIVLQVLDGRNAPVYFKNLEPRKKFAFTPEMSGPFIVSIADINTKATMRLEDIQGDDVLVYDGEDLTVQA